MLLPCLALNPLLVAPVGLQHQEERRDWQEPWRVLWPQGRPRSAIVTMSQIKTIGRGVLGSVFSRRWSDFESRTILTSFLSNHRVNAKNCCKLGEVVHIYMGKKVDKAMG